MCAIVLDGIELELFRPLPRPILEFSPAMVLTYGLLWRQGANLSLLWCFSQASRKPADNILICTVCKDDGHDFFPTEDSAVKAVSALFIFLICDKEMAIKSPKQAEITETSISFATR